jgi:putative ABC transport system permease protein
MSTVRRFFFRLISFIRRGHHDRDLEREISAHLALLEQEYLHRGLTPPEARLAARRKFGQVDQTREIHLDARSFRWLDDATRDVQYVIRTLRRAPVFTVAAVLTLAVGIGGTTAVFSLFNAVLLRPLPLPDPQRLVLVYEENSRSGFARDAVRPRHYAAWAADNDVFDAVAAIASFGAVLGGRGEPERITACRVTRSFFAAMGIEPALGRVFEEDEDRPGGARVAVLSAAFWQRRFGGDPHVVGRSITLNDEQHVIVGVMPERFQFLHSYVAVWVPAAFSSGELSSGGRYLTVLGRMKPDVAPARVRANLDTIAARMSSLSPADERWKSLRAVVVPFEEQVSGSARRPLIFLLTATGVVLLIACANLASLLLARTATRRQEIALRGALGASRARVIRQLLTESLLLSAAGLLAGVILARWAFTFLEQLVPPTMTLFTGPGLDARTLAIATFTALGTGILFGLAPALQSAAGLGDALKSAGRAARTTRWRNGLVVAQIAMTLVLLVAAALLLQTLYRLRYSNLGLQPEQVLTLRTPLPLARYGEHWRRTAFYEDVLQRVGSLPGVVAAGYTTSVPLEWRGGTSVLVVDGRERNPALPYDANHRQVSAGYLHAMGIPLRRGRYFDATDDAQRQPVVIINESMARTYWPGEDPIGKRLALDPQQGAVKWMTIVGVVGDVRQMGLDVPPRPEFYIPHPQFDTQPWFAPRDLVVRTAGNPTDLVMAIKREIHAVDPGVAISNVRPMDDILDEEVASRRIGSTILVAFAGFAVLLAVVGIYGVIAYFVVQHVPEMGIRLALGAQARDIVTLIAGKGIILALSGIGIGGVAALAATRLMSSLLYGFTAADYTVCVLAGTLLLALAAAASYVPARRASRLDPIVSLRAE